MSQFFIDSNSIPGSSINTLSAENGPATPPNGNNFNFSGTVAGGSSANGAIVFSTPSNGEMEAVVQTDGVTIQINASNQLEVISGEYWQLKASDFTAVRGQGYLINNVGLVNVTLPSSPLVGDTFEVAEISTGTFKLVQNPGDSIRLGSQLTTTTTGSITSTQPGDNIKLVCWASGPGASWIAFPTPGSYVVT